MNSVLKYRTRQRSCRSEHAKGVADRRASPLSNGLYKLLEVPRYPEGAMLGLQDFQRQRRTGSAGYYAGDVAQWLREVAIGLAYPIGKDLIPSIRALPADGLPPGELARHLPRWQVRERVLIAQVEEAHSQLRSSGAAHEFALWDMGTSELVQPCETFFEIISEALQVFDKFVPGQIPQDMRLKYL